MAWNAWTVQVSQRHYRAYKRGGTWIEPAIWRACRAKEAQEKRSLKWGAGGGQSRSSKPSGPNASARPKPRGAHTEPKPEGQGPQPATAKAASPAKGAKEVGELRDFIAQQQQWQQQMCTLLSQLQPNGGVHMPPPPPPPAAVQASPEERENEENRWAKRRLDTTAKLLEWKGKLAEARERQRRANRAMDDVRSHIAHWERKLQAVECRVDYDAWEKLGKLEPTNWDYDSDEDSEAAEDEMSTADQSTAFWSQKQSSNPHTPPAAPIAISNKFQFLASETAFQQEASPFKESDTSAQVQDNLAMANAQMMHMKQQGAQHGIPEEVMEQSVTEGHAMELIVSCWHQAKLAAELLICKKVEQDLSHSPLAQRMAKHLVNTLPSSPPADVSAQQQRDAAEAAGDVQ